MIVAGKKGYLLVEGHGEVEAAQNLIIRLSQDLSLYNIPWTKPRRWPLLHIPAPAAYPTS